MRKRLRKLCCIKKIMLEHSFTLKIFTRGVFLPIPTANKSSIFGLASVNKAQDLMPVKDNALLMYKLHPNVQYTMHLGNQGGH